MKQDLIIAVDVGTSSLTLEYQLIAVERGQTLGEARTVNVAVDAASHRSIPLPAAARALLTGAGAGRQNND